jgi:hypothetical protein
LGANFREILGVLRYSKSNWEIMSKLIIAQVGADTSASSYGQDIYKSYDLVNNKNNAKLLQGYKELKVFAELKASYLLQKKWDIRLFGSIKGISNDYSNKREINYFFTIGINTLFYNDERDF